MDASKRLKSKQRKQVIKAYDNYSEGISRLIGCNVIGYSEQYVCDYLQDTYIAYMKALIENKVVDNIKAWLYRTAVNITMAHNRRLIKYYRETVFDGKDFIIDNLSTVDNYATIFEEKPDDLYEVYYFEIVQIIASHLTDRQQRIYDMDINQKLSRKEISQRLNISESTISREMNYVYDFVVHHIRRLLYGKE